MKEFKSLIVAFLVLVVLGPVSAMADGDVDSTTLWRMSDSEFSGMEEMVAGWARESADKSRVALWQAVQLAKSERTMMRSSIGFIVFVSSTCPHCAKQKEILGEFVSRWGGWSPFLVIDVAAHSDKAMEYDVTSVPATFIAADVRGERVEGKVSQGVMEIDSIEDVLIRAYRTWFKQGE